MTAIEIFWQNATDLINWIWNDMTTTQLLLIFGGVWLVEKIEPKMLQELDDLAEKIKNRKAKG